MPRFARPLALLLLLAACDDGATDPDDGGRVTDAGRDDAGRQTDGGPPGGPICAEVAREMLDGQPIDVCLTAFETSPRVRLPADSAGVAYGGLAVADEQLVFRTRAGDLPVGSEPWVAEEQSARRYGYHLYRASLVDGAIESVTPVARIDDRVLMRPLRGLTLEGVVSERESSGGETRFAFESLNARVRIELDAALDETVVDPVGTGQPRFALYGTVVNATAPVRAADGSCLPALTDLGEANPLHDAADARVFLLRHPDMHGAFDDVVTLDWPAGVTSTNNMGSGLFSPTADLLLDDPPAPSGYFSGPHGVPWGGPSAELTVVEGGGGGC